MTIPHQKLARGQGLEPQFPRPERGVLPLDDPRKSLFISSDIF